MANEFYVRKGLAIATASIATASGATQATKYLVVGDDSVIRWATASVTSGASGTSGINGTSGTSGSSGINGTSGSSGTRGTSGTSGINGTSGTSGTRGTSGTSGTSGVTGTTGAQGQLPTLIYDAETSGGSSAPANGGFHFTYTSSFANITAVIINETDYFLIPQSGFLDTIKIGDNFLIRAVSNTDVTSNFGIFEISGITDNGSYRTYAVSPLSGQWQMGVYSGLCGIEVIRSGGSSGTSGTRGTSGTSGVNGTSGTSGINGTSGTSGTSFVGTGLVNKIALWSSTTAQTYDTGLQYTTGAEPTILAVGTVNKFTIGGYNSGLRSNSYAQFEVKSYSDTLFPLFSIGRSRGTMVSPTATQNADNMGEVRWLSDYGETANIKSLATQNHSVGNSGGKLQFKTTPNTTTTSLTRMEISHDGLVGIGTTPVAGQKLSVSATGFMGLFVEATGATAAFGADIGISGARTSGGIGLIVRSSGSTGTNTGVWSYISREGTNINVGYNAESSNSGTGNITFYTVGGGSIPTAYVGSIIKGFEFVTGPGYSATTTHGIYIDTTNGVGTKNMLTLKNGNEGVGKVLTSDVTGNANWSTNIGTTGSTITLTGNLVLNTATASSGVFSHYFQVTVNGTLLKIPLYY